jgi:hypothetical protein
MAFNTYQAERYIEYLTQHEKVKADIYRFIASAPHTLTRMGQEIGQDYYGIRYRMKKQTLTFEELITLLNFIK